MTELVTNDRIIDSICKAVRFVNEQLPPGERMKESRELVLVGQAGHLDSLQFVNFVVTLEQILSDDLKLRIILTESEVLANQKEIFATVQTLADYIDSRAKENEHGQDQS